MARWFPLCFSSVFAIAVGVFSFTPLAWRLMGSPDETYPELYFLGFGLPAALVLLIASAAIAFFGSRERGGPMQRALHSLWWIFAATVFLSALLVVSLFGYLPSPAVQVVPVLCLIAWPCFLLISIYATIHASRLSKS